MRGVRSRRRDVVGRSDVFTQLHSTHERRMTHTRWSSRCGTAAERTAPRPTRGVRQRVFTCRHQFQRRVEHDQLEPLTRPSLDARARIERSTRGAHVRPRAENSVGGVGSGRAHHAGADLGGALVATDGHDAERCVVLQRALERERFRAFVVPTLGESERLVVPAFAEPSAHKPRWSPVARGGHDARVPRTRAARGPAFRRSHSRRPSTPGRRSAPFACAVRWPLTARIRS